MPSWNQLLYQFVSGLKEEKEEEAEQGGKRKNKKEMEREEKLREGIVVLLILDYQNQLKCSQLHNILSYILTAPTFL